jgi:hypothetical protein
MPEHLLSKHKVLHSIPSTSKKKRKGLFLLMISEVSSHSHLAISWGPVSKLNIFGREHGVEQSCLPLDICTAKKERGRSWGPNIPFKVMPQ